MEKKKVLSSDENGKKVDLACNSGGAHLLYVGQLSIFSQTSRMVDQNKMTAKGLNDLKNY